MFFGIFISFVILQRFAELFIAKRNEKIMHERGAVEFDQSGYKYIVLMHTGFFIFLIAEKTLLGRGLNDYWIYFLIIFVGAQALRYWAVFSLGYYWNTKIIVLKGSGLVKKGPYKYLKHPNYTAVIIEIAVIPLIFSCYITFILFSLLNIYMIKRRTKIEVEALNINR